MRFKGKQIGDVLAMSVDEAVEFFAAHRSIHHALRLLQDVGLGYLTLGQQSPTLSGGEAQRIKLVTELAKVRTRARRLASAGACGACIRERRTLYVLDEPTVGLHMADVEKLIRVLHRLVDAGNTVVVIEHNLDVIAERTGSSISAPRAATPADASSRKAPRGRRRGGERSHTARVLGPFLRERRS